MVKDLQEYINTIKRALKRDGFYNSALDLQINSAATAARAVDMASDDIAKLDCTTVWEETRYGQKLAPHPVFKILKEQQESLTRQLKALGLTVADLSAGTGEEDKLTELTKKVKKAQSKKVDLLRPEL